MICAIKSSLNILIMQPLDPPLTVTLHEMKTRKLRLTLTRRQQNTRLISHLFSDGKTEIPKNNVMPGLPASPRNHTFDCPLQKP